MALAEGVLFAIIAMLGWGVADLFVLLALKKTDVMKVLAVSQVMGVVLYSLVFFLFFDFPKISMLNAAILIAGGLLTMMFYYFFYKALEVGKVSVVSPIAGLWSVITVVLSILFLNEKLNSVLLTGVILCISGSVLVSFKFHDLLSLKFANVLPGVGFAILSAFADGLYFFFVGLLKPELGWFIPIFLTKAIGVLFLILYFGSSRRSFRLPKGAYWLVFMIGVLEFAGYLGYGLGISKNYTAIVAPVAALFPAITILLAWIFLKESVELNQKIGIIAALTGIVLLSL